MRAISGYLKNSRELYHSTSGGLSTALAQAMIDAGGIVYGVRYTEDFYSAQYVRIQSHATIKLVQGTKYIRANPILANGGNVYLSCCDDLSNDKNVLFVGLPCEIFTLQRKIQEKQINASKLYTVDLVCHGPTEKSVQQQFVRLLENRYNSKVVFFNTRAKTVGWETASLLAIMENGQKYVRKLNDTEFGIAFNVMPQRCAFSCKFKGNNHFSDLTIGDYWGCDRSFPEYNLLGVSVGFDHTGRIFDLLSDDLFKCFETDEKHARLYNPRYDTPLEIGRDYWHFKRLYDKYGLEYACQHRYSLLSKIKKMFCFKR